MPATPRVEAQITSRSSGPEHAFKARYAAESGEEARRALEDARSAQKPGKLERDYRRRLSLFHKEEEARFSKRSGPSSILLQRAKVADRRSLMSTACFWLG